MEINPNFHFQPRKTHTMSAQPNATEQFTTSETSADTTDYSAKFAELPHISLDDVKSAIDKFGDPKIIAKLTEDFKILRDTLLDSESKLASADEQFDAVLRAEAAEAIGAAPLKKNLDDLTAECKAAQEKYDNFIIKKFNELNASDEWIAKRSETMGNLHKMVDEQRTKFNNMKPLLERLVPQVVRGVGPRQGGRKNNFEFSVGQQLQLTELRTTGVNLASEHGFKSGQIVKVLKVPTGGGYAWIQLGGKGEQVAVTHRECKPFTH
jgi:hypothetical protein